MDYLNSNGFLSSVNIASLTPWMSTTSASEVIIFKDERGNQLQVNDLTVYASGCPLYIQINTGSQVLHVPSGSSVKLDGQSITQIAVLGEPSILRYDAQYK